MALQFLITDAGRAAIAQVGGAIGPVTLTKIAIGSAGYTPTSSRTALQSEIKRLDPSGSSVPVPGTIHMTTQDDSADSYSVKEIGLYTNNGILFAIYSQSTAIITKGSTASALFALDFVMTNVPPGTVTVGDAGFSYAQANETRLGVLAIATTAEAQEGTNDAKIITPLKLAQVTATSWRRGVIALATTAEAQALVPDATKALTVARLVDRTANTGRAGVVVLATNAETQAGTDAAKAVTPAALASLATDTRPGLVELATNSETQDGTDTTRAVTPAALASRTATDTRTGVVELATNAETQAGTDTSRAVTPASLASAAALFVPPGAVMDFALQTAPSGWLALDGKTIGSAASGSQYAGDTYFALFNALWLNWTQALLPIQTSTGVVTSRGASAAADFAANKRLPLPDIRGYFRRSLGANADGTASGDFGAKQADDFKSHAHAVTQTAHAHSYSDSYTNQDPGGGGGSGSSADVGGDRSRTTGAANANISINATGGSETRPRNIPFLSCIKF